MKALEQGVLREIITLLKFGVVGVLAAVVHLLVAISLLLHTDSKVLAANSIAFLCAFLFSFLGHFHWTFKTGSNKGRSLVRFLAIALAAFITNNLVLISLTEKGAIGEKLAVVIAVIVIPIVSYFGSRLWGFKGG